MRNLGIGLLLFSVLLLLGAFFGPMALWLATMDSPQPPQPADFRPIILIPLVCLPAALVSGVAGIVLLIAVLRRGRHNLGPVR